MRHKIITVNEYVIDIDYSVEKDLKSFKEEVLNELYNLYRTHGINDLLFSGGMDSTFILRSLLELGIKPNLHSFIYCDDYDEFDIRNIRFRCKKYGLKEPEYFPIQPDKIFRHIEELAEKNIVYPALHQYYMDYFIKSTTEKIFTGLGSEYRLHDKCLNLYVPPILTKHNNPNRIFDFTSDRTFLSYVNNPILKNNYDKSNPICPLGENIWHVRDLIYQDCFSDIDIIEKDIPGDRPIYDVFDEKYVSILQRQFPISFMIKKFIFNLEDYYNRNSLKSFS